MAKADKVARLIKKFSSNTLPFRRFFPAVRTIPPPSIRYESTNKTIGTISILPLQITPAINSAAPMPILMISPFLFSSFFSSRSAFTLRFFSLITTPSSTESHAFCNNGSKSFSESEATCNCFVANVRIAS